MDVQDGFILGIYNYCDRWSYLRIDVALPRLCGLRGTGRSSTIRY